MVLDCFTPIHCKHRANIESPTSLDSYLASRLRCVRICVAQVSGIRLPDILVSARFCLTGIRRVAFNWCGRVRKASKKNVKSLPQESYTKESLETVKKVYDEVVRSRKRKTVEQTGYRFYLIPGGHIVGPASFGELL